MSVIGSKLLMCVCAGATGAAVVPVAQRARAALGHRSAVHGPAVHRSAAVHHRAAPSASAPLPVNCTLSIAGFTPVALPVEAAPQSAAAAAAAPMALGGFGVAGFGDSGIGGGVISPGMGQGGGGGGGVSPGAAPGFPAAPEPVDSVPEPGTWTMMISGFGLAGTGMRWQRRVAA